MILPARPCVFSSLSISAVNSAILVRARLAPAAFQRGDDTRQVKAQEGYGTRAKGREGWSRRDAVAELLDAIPPATTLAWVRAKSGGERQRTAKACATRGSNTGLRY